MKEKDIKINFLTIERDAPIKMSLQNTSGLPTFGKEATKLMGLWKGKLFKIAKGRREKCIFLFPTNDPTDSLVMSKRGLSYVINKPNMFRKIGFLKGNKYTITKEIYQGEPIFKISL